MQNDIAKLLIDPETGQLKSFDRWRRDIKGITDHYETDWLQTEYNTAVIRAHQAADWKHFLEEADVFPNVRWMPTTSITPDPLHQRYWQLKLTLPVNHPFWDEHHPGDRWNCKCSLQQTDEPVNAEALEGWTPPLPMPGLDNNPANDGKLFSDTHPYITEAYPGARDAVGKTVFEAKSVEDVYDFIHEYIAEEVSWDVKKSQLKSASQLLNQLKERMEFYGLPKFKKFGENIKNGGIAAYDAFADEIKFSPKLLNDSFSVRQYNNEQAFFKKYGFFNTSGHFAGDYVRSVVDHELGHVVLHKHGYIYNDAMMTQSKDLRRSKSLGYYSGTDVDEYVAECFATYWGPGRDEMNEIELDFMERVFKKCNFTFYR